MGLSSNTMDSLFGSLASNYKDADARFWLRKATVAQMENEERARMGAMHSEINSHMRAIKTFGDTLPQVDETQIFDVVKKDITNMFLVEPEGWYTRNPRPLFDGLETIKEKTLDNIPGYSKIEFSYRAPQGKHQYDHHILYPMGYLTFCTVPDSAYAQNAYSMGICGGCNKKVLNEIIAGFGYDVWLIDERNKKTVRHTNSEGKDVLRNLHVYADEEGHYHPIIEYKEIVLEALPVPPVPPPPSFDIPDLVDDPPSLPPAPSGAGV